MKGLIEFQKVDTHDPIFIDPQSVDTVEPAQRGGGCYITLKSRAYHQVTTDYRNAVKAINEALNEN
jgi:hypothetical protein